MTVEPIPFSVGGSLKLTLCEGKEDEEGLLSFLTFFTYLHICICRNRFIYFPFLHIFWPFFFTYLHICIWICHTSSSFSPHFFLFSRRTDLDQILGKDPRTPHLWSYPKILSPCLVYKYHCFHCSLVQFAQSPSYFLTIGCKNTYCILPPRASPFFWINQKHKIMEILKFIIIIECQCFNHADRCRYDEEVERLGLSVTPEGIFEGGGRCIGCKVSFDNLIF